MFLIIVVIYTASDSDLYLLVFLRMETLASRSALFPRLLNACPGVRRSPIIQHQLQINVMPLPCSVLVLLSLTICFRSRRSLQVVYCLSHSSSWSQGTRRSLWSWSSSRRSSPPSSILSTVVVTVLWFTSPSKSPKDVKIVKKIRRKDDQSSPCWWPRRGYRSQDQ